MYQSRILQSISSTNPLMVSIYAHQLETANYLFSCMYESMVLYKPSDTGLRGLYAPHEDEKKRTTFNPILVVVSSY